MIVIVSHRPKSTSWRGIFPLFINFLSLRIGTFTNFVKYYIDNNNVCFSLISGEIYLMFKVGVISMKIGQNFLELHELTNAKIYLG